MAETKTKSLESTIRDSLFGSLPSPTITAAGDASLPSWFDVTGLCTASIGVACAEIAGLSRNTHPSEIKVDRKLASLWFGMTIRPQGWKLPPIWDDLAGLYRTSDGWIRLHTNAKHHKAAALRVLNSTPDRERIAKIVGDYKATDLETSIVEEGGCAATLMSLQDWAQHPQGRAVNSEPLIDWKNNGEIPAHGWQHGIEQPLEGLRVVDCTRVLAGPVCTRFLAGYGADVLRIDPPGWEEANIVPEVTLGKRTATLDLKSESGRAAFLNLIATADVFVHGYRKGALENLGLGTDILGAINPSLISVSLNAYGWTGPWSERRGFDSLVQMSTGIAHLGMQRDEVDHPVPLPVQALDQATGYLMAAASIRALRIRQLSGTVLSARVSLARTASLLISTLGDQLADASVIETPDDLSPTDERTDWGSAYRIRFPVSSSGVTPQWSIPAGRLHKDSPEWAHE